MRQVAMELSPNSRSVDQLYGSDHLKDDSRGWKTTWRTASVCWSMRWRHLWAIWSKSSCSAFASFSSTLKVSDAIIKYLHLQTEEFQFNSWGWSGASSPLKLGFFVFTCPHQSLLVAQGGVRESRLQDLETKIWNQETKKLCDNSSNNK